MDKFNESFSKQKIRDDNVSMIVNMADSSVIQDDDF